ncbi:protein NONRESPONDING TO OXYLIPINS 2, mitochondrial-like [Hibiscus syriacus]|uniref:protein NONRESPONDING TO OXYLIPINS 2, mitochondrial-like n=1 Tax=Hibiscus syriacus TaxID=106335 RepID=UPI0019216558|nr:protein NONRESPONDING TO OXYLIPINS 2, mitochondrial-like [Hibiscus syriacus]
MEGLRKKQPAPLSSTSGFNQSLNQERTASFCRSAIMAGSRTVTSRSKTLSLKSLSPKPNSSPSTRSLPRASRIVSALGGLESMMPLHSAIASAQLQSSIALDSSCWSCLSQGITFAFLFIVCCIYVLSML